ncbi:hypothetical protein Micbo1qcDRAFT_160822 [Microdochium bolleyi]|uniref:Uncharacterized protein n=1 Tax=Microdochium bolleyi TaxID=196109 RepID=A0A136J6Z7_9PEZI|nr:hypothetical protein Micbo1qcDRAFT_160822 [Microdochium bolleyi]
MHLTQHVCMHNLAGAVYLSSVVSIHITYLFGSDGGETVCSCNGFESPPALSRCLGGEYKYF